MGINRKILIHGTDHPFSQDALYVVGVMWHLNQFRRPTYYLDWLSHFSHLPELGIMAVDRL